MSLLSAKLDQLEARIKTLIEGRLAGLFSGREVRDHFLQHLVYAMQTGTQLHADGTALAPDVYVLLVDPHTAPSIETNPTLLTELSTLIQQAGEKSGLRFAREPRVYVSPNAEIPRNTLDVVTRISQDGLGETVELTTRTGADHGNIPAHAFLIVNGVRIYDLEQPVVNIGRRDDNDLVIDDPRVSRSHAQLRAAHGKYILFDLDSKGGSFVNGQRIVQKVLAPQDVISLAGVPMVYGQESFNSAILDQTQEMDSPPNSEQEDGEPSSQNNHPWLV
jgi:hypothetical protein